LCLLKFSFELCSKWQESLFGFWPCPAFYSSSWLPCRMCQLTPGSLRDALGREMVWMTSNQQYQICRCRTVWGMFCCSMGGWSSLMILRSTLKGSFASRPPTPDITDVCGRSMIKRHRSQRQNNASTNSPLELWVKLAFHSSFLIYIRLKQFKNVLNKLILNYFGSAYIQAEFDIKFV